MGRIPPCLFSWSQFSAKTSKKNGRMLRLFGMDTVISKRPSGGVFNLLSNESNIVYKSGVRRIVKCRRSLYA